MKKNGFFAILARMKHITRWGLMRNAVRESLSEHSFDTAVIAHCLAVIGQTYFEKDVDPGEIAAAALFHDASEILTGDMPAPVKYNNASIKEAYKSIEDHAVTALVSMLPEALKPKYKVLFNYHKDKPEFYQYIKAADKISAYIKCLEERKCGNLEFQSAEQSLKEVIRGLNLPEADYFMENFSGSFTLTLDELQGED